jgi:N-acetylglutamate synthase-like GNAT family acetyltransferase/anti-sigma regulatory factor (Ser/Thr protein kinase)
VSRVKLTVPSDPSARALVQAVLPAFATSAGIPAEDARRLEAVVDTLVRYTLENAYPDDELGELEVTLEASDASVAVTVHDWGLPLTSAGGEFGPLPGALANLAHARDVQLLNLGADGKRLVAQVPVQSSGDVELGRHHLEATPRRAPADAEMAQAIQVRSASTEDAEAIAQLLYENYHLSYVHADFYRPRYLMAVLGSGELESTIALHEGRVIGHHALMPLPDVSSAETGAAVVHSAYRGLGVFGRLFEHTLGRATHRGLASVFGDAVTIHPFSQRAERSHGYRETALQLGMVPAQTTMRGFGGEGPTRRTATLRSYRPLDAGQRQVNLPTLYRELLEGVYTNVGLSIEAREEPETDAGERVTVDVDEPRALGFLRLRRWDADAATAVRGAARHLLSQHVDIAYADIDLVGVHEVDEATILLNELGFFAAGLLLHGPEGHDHFRMQLLDCEDVELENIVCDSPFAESLCRQVLADKTRVGV